ncbi:hypothetical protein JAAARDRAFT_588750 [Jaapia argillacea MUCL 33604]|uniref:Uncharacterized protein n=1 Tax=Jaapia argillacea MUCL 33604 TaxID=933084 RepID=A0A067PGT7_9AGAM|nr:hypothetical protein JAAARDRAFT_588750 [Jaapia argillacea MUCL 33604]
MVLFTFSSHSCMKLNDRPLFEDDCDAVQFAQAFSIESDDTTRSSLLLQEQFLARYPTPYFMMRVADLRATFGSVATALELYKKEASGLWVPSMRHGNQHEKGNFPSSPSLHKGRTTSVDDGKRQVQHLRRGSSELRVSRIARWSSSSH